MVMRNRTTLLPLMLAVAVWAAACGSSEPETVTGEAPAEEPSQPVDQAPVEDDQADGSAADGSAADGGEVSDSGEGAASGSDESDDSASSSGEDSGASSSSSSDDAEASSAAVGDEDSGASSDDADSSSGYSGEDSGAGSASGADDVEASSAAVGDEDSGMSSSSSSDDAAASSGSSGEDSGAGGSSGSDDADGASGAGSPDDTVSVSSDQIVGDGADITDPGPSTSGGPAPPQERRQPAHITGVVMQVLESWPAQVIVQVSGELPDPCHELWWEVAVDGNTYDVEVWSVSPPPDSDLVCAMMIQPFVENVPLGGGFVAEDYTVIVNGEVHELNF